MAQFMPQQRFGLQGGMGQGKWYVGAGVQLPGQNLSITVSPGLWEAPSASTPLLTCLGWCVHSAARADIRVQIQRVRRTSDV